MAIRFSNGFGIGASNNGGGSLSFFTNLKSIATYLRGYMSDFRNPDFYEYWLDGDGFYIYDGGNDMYDSGNATSPWLISNVAYTGSTSANNAGAYPYAINYQTTNNTGTMDNTFGYISLGYSQYSGGIQNTAYHPLTVIGTRATSANPGDPIGFQTGGNSGSDGGGNLATGNIYTGDTVSGFTVHSFYREEYNAGDPSHCDVYILLGHTDWSSVFGDVYYGADPASNGGCGGYLYTSGNGCTNILAVKTLLSKQSGVEVTFNEVKAVVDNFIIRIKEAKELVPAPTPTPTPTPSPLPLTQPSNDGSSNNYGTILLLDGAVATSGNTILDQSGHGNDLTFNGSNPYVSSFYYDFNSGTFAQMIDSTVFNNLANTMSITMWVNFPSIPTGQSLFSRTSGNNPGWAFRVSSGQFNLVKYNVADQYSNGSFSLTNNTWYHFGIVQGGTSLMFTLNGVVVGALTSDNTNFANNNYAFWLCRDTYINSIVPMKLGKLTITDGFKTSATVLSEFNSEKATYGY